MHSKMNSGQSNRFQLPKRPLLHRPWQSQTCIFPLHHQDAVLITIHFSYDISGLLYLKKKKNPWLQYFQMERNASESEVNFH